MSAKLGYLKNFFMPFAPFLVWLYTMPLTLSLAKCNLSGMNWILERFIVSRLPNFDIIRIFVTWNSYFKKIESCPMHLYHTHKIFSNFSIWNGLYPSGDCFGISAFLITLIACFASKLRSKATCLESKLTQFRLVRWILAHHNKRLMLSS